jgi:hypothetical protein
MKWIKLRVGFVICFSVSFLVFFSANAFIGNIGSVPMLAKILAESIKHYKQFKTMISQGNDLIYNAAGTKAVLDRINSGLDNALNLLDALPIEDEKVLAELRDFSQAYAAIQDLYGSIPSTPESKMLLIHDKTIAESLKITNMLKEYAREQEQNARSIMDQSHHASPKGAGKITAQGTGAILFTLNQILRVNGQILKLQSEIMGMQNKGGKEAALHYHRVHSDIQKSLRGFKGDFSIPKIE